MPRKDPTGKYKCLKELMAYCQKLKEYAEKNNIDLGKIHFIER